ncbi:hypothetical protein PN574_19115, partial [Parabacteroides merdae]|uniref:hypothetical protein n=1 Tax=Parabacteroides merdae TaxID=46503 RepID=UPI0023310B67
MCFIAGSPGRVAIRPDFFFTRPWERIDPFSDALLFLSVSRGREKTKKQKETPRLTGFFSQAPHSFFSKPTGKNGQVARLNLT